jgi:hypothetical protein
VTVRQALHRVREKFADLLLDAVAQTLDTPTAEQLEEEVLTLGLYIYCRPGAVDPRRNSGNPCRHRCGRRR